MKYLVTGGAGFIGSNLVKRLVKDGQSVRVLDNFSTGKRQNLSDVASKIEIIEGDIRDFNTVRETAEAVDFIIHLAALVSVPLSIKDPIASHEVNVTGTLNVLESARQAGVKKVVIASSSAVYGDTKKLPIAERTELSPMSPYAVAKLTGEYYARIYWEMYKLPTVSLRFFNIYGPNQNPDGDYAAVIPKFIGVISDGRRPTVYGDGEQTRDFVYIDDAVQAILLAATNDSMAGLEVNVGSGQPCTLNQLLKNLAEIAEVEIDADYSEPRKGDILNSNADISLLKSFGFSPRVDLKRGLKKTYDFIKSQKASPKPVSKVGR